MTPQRAKELLPIFTAFANGEEIQFRNPNKDDGWVDSVSHKLSFNCEGFEYRIKPKPVTRPWSKPEDVPGPVCWIQATTTQQMLVESVGEAGITACGNFYTWKEIVGRAFTNSTDRKTWFPCTVMEEQP